MKFNRAIILIGAVSLAIPAFGFGGKSANNQENHSPQEQQVEQIEKSDKAIKQRDQRFEGEGKIDKAEGLENQGAKKQRQEQRTFRKNQRPGDTLDYESGTGLGSGEAKEEPSPSGMGTGADESETGGPAGDSLNDGGGI